MEERARRGAGREGPGLQLVLAEAADLSRQIEADIRRRAALRVQLADYIEAMPDSLTREIFKRKSIQ